MKNMCPLENGYDDKGVFHFGTLRMGDIVEKDDKFYIVENDGPRELTVEEKVYWEVG